MHDCDEAVDDAGVPGKDAELRVEGVAMPIHTRVTRRGEHGMTVEQPLPFLQLRTRVQDQAARRSRIESVSMVVYDGMPRLVLDLAYEDDVAHQADVVGEPAGVPETTGVHQALPGIMRPRRAAGLDDTQSFERPSDAPPLTAAAGAVVGRAERSAPGEAPRESTLVFETQVPAAGEAATADDDVLAIEQMHADRLGPRLQRAWVAARPRVIAALQATRTLCERATAWLAPRLRRASATVAAQIAARLRRRNAN